MENTGSFAARHGISGLYRCDGEALYCGLRTTQVKGAYSICAWRADRFLRYTQF